MTDAQIAERLSRMADVLTQRLWDLPATVEIRGKTALNPLAIRYQEILDHIGDAHDLLTDHDLEYPMTEEEVLNGHDR